MEVPPKLRLSKKANAIDCSVGQQIRKWRLAQNIEAIELADKLGVTYQQLRKYEKGLTRLTVSRLYEIARVLDVPIHWFFLVSGWETGQTAVSLPADLIGIPKMGRCPLTGRDRRCPNNPECECLARER